MEFLIFAALLGVIVGAIAKSKGRSFGVWWVYGTLLFIVAIIHVLVIAPDKGNLERREIAEGGKKCPSCAEVVKVDANVCRFCRHDFVT
jgi:gas vesicle protein